MRYAAILTLCTVLSPVSFASEEMRNIFKEVWDTAKSKIAPQELEEKFFTQKNFEQLSEKAGNADSLPELSRVLNEFFQKLPVSHTQFMTKHDLDYYFFQSLFGTRDIEKPQIYHIGAQFTQEGDGSFRVKSVFEGYPADKAKLRKGDLVLSADEKSFRPVETFADGKPHFLKIARGNTTYEVKIKPVLESIHESLLNATQNSEKVIEIQNKKIGYVHLWSGTHEKFQSALASFVTKNVKVHGMILDLRDGYGGAWYSYLDPFFKDRTDFFESTTTLRDGTQSVGNAEKVSAHQYYDGPLVVLTNNGVRSGKESLAFQFKKSKRATLIGETTGGYFSLGEINFLDKKKDYLLYLSIGQLVLDKQVLEKKGVSPDIEVSFPIDKALSCDPQFKAALEFLEKGKVTHPVRCGG